jgi:hypothetical protein
MEKALRKFEVIATYPHSQFEIGEILTQYYFKTSQTGIYCYVTDTEIVLRGKNMKSDFVENMPHIFKEILLDSPKVLTNEMKVCIKGDGTLEYGAKIMEYLVKLGGEDTGELSCNSSHYYYINQYFIDGKDTIPEGYKEISLK